MELLVRIRWRHVAPADLSFDVEQYHSVRDLLDAATEFWGAQWDASQPVYLERSAEQLPLDAPILDSGIVSGDTLRFELYGVDHVDRDSLSEAVSCDVTAGPEAGRSFVLLPGRHEVGRRVGNDVVLDDPTVSDHHLSIIVFDDLTTQLLPDPAATNPVIVNGRHDHRRHTGRRQRRRAVRGDGCRPAHLQPLVRHRARPTRPGAVPAHAVQAGDRHRAGLQADRQHAQEARAAEVLADPGGPAAW